ncbi:DTW domain-containing protein, partial [Vibrio furnissii]
PHFILLDGTWQEAKKMERKSPWLKDLPRVALSPQQLS